MTNLLVSSGKKMLVISAADVQYVTLVNGCCILVTSDEQQYLSSKGLTELVTVLSDDVFILISRSVMINVVFIDHIYISDGEKIVMQNGEEFKLARRRRKAFFDIVKRV